MNDESPFGTREYTYDILDQLQSKQISRTHFWGTHTGAAVGLMLVLQRPQMVSSLILEAPVIPGVTMPAVAAQMEATKSIAKTSGIKTAMEHWFDTAPWFEVMRQNPERHRADEQRRIILEFRGAPFSALVCRQHKIQSSIRSTADPFAQADSYFVRSQHWQEEIQREATLQVTVQAAQDTHGAPETFEL